MGRVNLIIFAWACGMFHSAVAVGSKFYKDAPLKARDSSESINWDEDSDSSASSGASSIDTTPAASPRKKPAVTSSPRKQQLTVQAIAALQRNSLAGGALFVQDNTLTGSEFTQETIQRYFVAEEQSSSESLDYWFDCAKNKVASLSLSDKKKFLADIYTKFKSAAPQQAALTEQHALENVGVNARRLLVFLYNNKCEEVNEHLPLIDTVHLYTQEDGKGYHVIDPKLTAPKIIFKNSGTGMSAGFWESAKKGMKFSSFFPKEWDRQQITQAVTEAFHHPVVTKKQYGKITEMIGKTNANMFIQMFITNSIEVLPFPLYDYKTVDGRYNDCKIAKQVLKQDAKRELFTHADTNQVVVDIASTIFAAQAKALNVPADKLRGYYVVVAKK